ncbi:Aste57867_5838 [Aphanomyces stellatus]|uniref:Aste57867_5838 protein n=1 Tax=Aphanomyces stellatus TaxID=120398 RepID=A0A485KH91_9STRA|nr:hypothetical protein As57867_005824 [Aphanomyces stellatus]VFT82861.1 Aste57867_5838 [Aphanomyces stellatus]
MSPSSASSTVLRCRDLVHVILAYQCGLFHDALPLLTLTLSSDWESPSALQAETHRLHSVLAPWYDQRHFEAMTRLHRLRPSASYVSLLSCVVVEAISFGRDDVVDACDVHDLAGLPQPLVDVAACANDMSMLERLHAMGVSGCTDRALDAAAMHGNTGMIKFLAAQYAPTVSSQTMHLAAMANHITVLDMLWSMLPVAVPASQMRETLLGVAREGHLEALAWLVDHFVDVVTPQVMDIAAQHGHVTLLTWMTTHASAVGCTSAAMNLAARSGHVHVLEWLHVHRREGCSVHALDWAAAAGHLHAVQWLVANRTERRSPMALTLSLAHRQWHVADWLWSHVVVGLDNTNQLTFVWQVIDAVAARGDVEAMTWLHHRVTRRQWSRNAMDVAAAAGRLDMLRWLHANRSDGCSPDSLNVALVHGHSNVAKWLVEHYGATQACPAEGLCLAVRRADWKTLLWVHATMPHLDWPSDVMVAAAGANQLDVVQWLFTHRPETSSSHAIEAAAANGHLRVLEWLQGIEGWSSAVMDAAASEGRIEVLKWLQTHRTEGCTANALQRASANGWAAAVAWLLRHRRHICKELLPL